DNPPRHSPTTSVTSSATVRSCAAHRRGGRGGRGRRTASAEHSCATWFQPFIEYPLEHGKRHGRCREPNIVEIADIELRSEPLSCLRAQCLPARLSHLVARCLTGPGAVTLDLGGHRAAVVTRG